MQPLEYSPPGRFGPAAPSPEWPVERLAAAADALSAEGYRIDARRTLALALTRALPHLSFNRTRTALLRAAGFRIGPRSWMMGPLDIVGPGDPRDRFSIDSDTLITGPLYVELSAEVRIGKRVRFGHHVFLLTDERDISSSRIGEQPAAASIIVGDGVWIGSHVTVLGGSRIGRGSVVAAGAVVCGDVPTNTLVGGVPARSLRDLDEQAPQSARRQRAVLLDNGEHDGFVSERAPMRRASTRAGVR